MSDANSTQTSATDSSAALRSQVDQLTAALRTAESELARLRSQLKTAETERDDYKSTLFSILPRESLTFSEEELRELKENGVAWETIEKDLEVIQEE